MRKNPLRCRGLNDFEIPCPPIKTFGGREAVGGVFFDGITEFWTAKECKSIAFSWFFSKLRNFPCLFVPDVVYSMAYIALSSIDRCRRKGCEE